MITKTEATTLKQEADIILAQVTRLVAGDRSIVIIDNLQNVAYRLAKYSTRQKVAN